MVDNATVERRTAIFVGRFAIVTRAHASTLSDLLERFSRVAVVVLRTENTFAPPEKLVRKHAEFYQLCDDNCVPSKNPFTPEERVAFWRAHVDSAQLQDRVDIEVSDRMELNPQLFNDRFPPTSHELVFVRPSDTAGRFDQIRRDSLSEILDRDISEMTPTFEEHTSDLRDRLVGRLPGWKDLLAQGVAAEFERLNGFERYFDEGTSDRERWDEVVAADIVNVRGSTSAPHATIERYRAHMSRLYERVVTSAQLATAPDPSGVAASRAIRGEVSTLSRLLASAARVDEITPAEQKLMTLYRLLFRQELPGAEDG